MKVHDKSVHVCKLTYLLQAVAACGNLVLQSELLCRPGRLLKFDIGSGGIQVQGGQPTGADLQYSGLANQRRGRADSCSKV